MKSKSNIGNVSIVNFKINKRGVVGSFLVNAIATIAIAMILILFILMSSSVKIAEGKSTGLKIHDENKIGIEGGEGYMENYAKLVEVKGKVLGGVFLDSAIQEVGYEK